MGRRLISCVVLAAALMACRLTGTSVAGNVAAATNATNQSVGISAAGNVATATNATNATNYPLTCLVIAESLNVRDGPGVEYLIIGYLSYGATVEVTAQAQAADGGTWARTDKGWVNRRWLECEKEVK